MFEEHPPVKGTKDIQPFNLAKSQQVTVPGIMFETNQCERDRFRTEFPRSMGSNVAGGDKVNVLPDLEWDIDDYPTLSTATGDGF